ncbi:unnamed protein product [Discosporangium mesarthrocarpum]
MSTGSFSSNQTFYMLGLAVLVSALLTLEGYALSPVSGSSSPWRSTICWSPDGTPRPSARGPRTSRDWTALRAGAEGMDARRIFQAAMSVKQDDLYIVGAGYLGTLIGKQWREKFPSATIYAETRTTSKHDVLRAEGVTPILRHLRKEGQRCTNVVFCASPSGNEDYSGEVAAAAAEVWDGEGTFVFTSSSGIYAENDGGTVTEQSPLSDSPRAAKLRGAELACTQAGGCVVRLAGLFSLERGPHNFWLGKEEVTSSPDGLINLLSYEDAAGVVIAVLLAHQQGRVFLAADHCPMTRRDICAAALSHPMYSDRSMPQAGGGGEAGTGGRREGKGKVFDSRVTRRDLSWEPRHTSFAEFIEDVKGRDGK